MSILENVPDNWITAEIGSINCYKSMGINPSENPDEIFELYSVPSFPTGKPELLKGSEIGSTKQCVEPGDVLLCKINPRINRVWKVAPKGLYRQIASSEWIVIRQKLIDTDFLRYLFSELSFRDLLCSDVAGVGGSLTRAQPARVSKYEILVASLEEQKEIATRLDKLLAQVGSIKLRLDKIEEIIKRFRQSVLEVACRGDSECIERSLEDFCSIISGNAFNSNSFIENGIPVIKISNIQHGKFINDPHQEYLPIDYLKIFKKFIVNPEDILLALTRPITNDTLKVCLYPSNGDLALLNQRVAVLRPNGNISKDYLILLMQSNFFKEKIKNNLSETLQPNLSPNDLAKIKIRCPDIYKQNQIVNMIKKQLSIEQCIEQRLKKTQLCINILTQSILSKAFRGELTSEWREQHPELISGENSAVALLERIKEEKNSVKNSVRPLKSAKNVKIALKRK